MAAIYYASMMEHRLSKPMVWDVVSLVVCASVVLHGATAAPLTRLYGRSAPRDDEPAAVTLGKVEAVGRDAERAGKARYP